MASDTFIETAFADGYAGKVRPMVVQALDHGIDSVEDAPAELKALFHHLETEPDWLDRALVELGAQVFRRFGTDAFFSFGVMTFEGYRLEHIQKPLVLTGAYTGGLGLRPLPGDLPVLERRVGTRSPAPGRAGRKTAVMVRIMHTTVEDSWRVSHVVAPASDPHDGPDSRI